MKDLVSQYTRSEGQADGTFKRITTERKWMLEMLQCVHSREKRHKRGDVAQIVWANLVTVHVIDHRTTRGRLVLCFRARHTCCGAGCTAEPF